MAEAGIIDEATFTFFVGDAGETSSYCDFGELEDDEGVTWFDTYEGYYWSVQMQEDSIKVGGKTIPTPAQYGVLDTGTSLMYFPVETAATIILQLAG